MTCSGRLLYSSVTAGPTASSTSGRGFFLADFVKTVTKSAAGGLLVREQEFQLDTYYPVFLYFLAIVGLVGVILIAAHVIGPRRRSVVKLMPYESGMDPVGDARQRFDVKFYLMAILFLVFDVELLFLYPWAVVAYRDPALLSADLAWPVFWEMLVFLATLVVAYVYAWRKGVFRWR